jgi:hypothetical protein
MTDEDLVKNLAWYREEAGLESAYPVTHPMSMFVRAIAARERLKKREWVGLTDEEYIDLIIQASKPMKTAPDMAVAFGHLVEAKLKEKNT